MKTILPLLLVFFVVGCSSWSTSSVNNRNSSYSASQAAAERLPANIMITETDLPSRRYETLGDIDVTVNKTTIFNKDPTREMVNEKLQEKAAKLGADAVILVRYGTVGVSFTSWGSLDGKGRAVRFVQ